MPKKGLYSNIHAKRKRIKSGSGETMRKAGSKGAPPLNRSSKQPKQPEIENYEGVGNGLRRQ